MNYALQFEQQKRTDLFISMLGVSFPTTCIVFEPYLKMTQITQADGEKSKNHSQNLSRKLSAAQGYN